ncbi:PREDICTED: BRCA1-A complex subunit RAP80 isoform X1 [Gavialis gangeticus]|uniref:BRCA1-A complex subunit RAP80 isoform X1 n=1 Tax=Gavialis gangeticus TaxID=94835 RepID=UPI00092EA1BB|nr:PREDICTED: BRCA1-A complex subunit RAP80 isoform X1 [Gavialis gangeticus]
MPKKKKPVEDCDSQTLAGDEDEQRGPASARKKRSFVDAFIVISDSDGEESKEENGLQRKRTKQQLERAKCAARRKIAQMTEEEQFALALRMSEQEARQVNCQEEEEEELLRKAIAESLHSCQPSSPPVEATSLPTPAAGMLPRGASPQGDTESAGALPSSPGSPSAEPCSSSRSLQADGSKPTGITRSPLVVLTRLSQEIVESSITSSIVVSPGKSQASLRADEQPASLAGSNTSSVAPNSPSQHLSPTFASFTPGTWRLMPRRLFPASCSPGKAAERDQDVPSPPDAGESGSQRSRTCAQHGRPRKSQGSGSAPCSQQLGDSREASVPTETGEQSEAPSQVGTRGWAGKACQLEEGKDTVHYYWGIPFCPKGADPNQYTQVILCQLEVYQKSLKQAQRRLLHKKEFGEPVIPGSAPSSPPGPGKAEGVARENGVEEAEDGDIEGRTDPGAGAWLLPSPARGPGENPECSPDGRSSASEEEPTTSYCQASQVLPAEDAPEDGEPMQITQSISALTPLGSKRSPDIAAESPAAEEITVCPETQPSPSEAIEPVSKELCSASRDAPGQAAGDEDVGGTSESSLAMAACVACPLCDQGFPATEIELHAMYCNGATGEDADEDLPVLTRRQREAKSRVVRGIPPPRDTDNRSEKCYLCKLLVPRREYERHVDGCLRAAEGALGTRRLRSAKDDGPEGRLLALLELSESKAAGAAMGVTSSAGASPRHLLSRAQDDAGNSSGGRCSPPHAALRDSPAKALMSLGEAAACLLDLEEPAGAQPGSRLQTKAARRRKRKF